MPEGLSATEIGKEISEHAGHAAVRDANAGRDRLISISEAVLLSMVTLLAAWSGYAAAKWNTESRLDLSKASTKRTEANRAYQEALTLRNFDSSIFAAWFTAYTVGNEQAMKVAIHRFRPEFRVAFDAWRATKPETNPDAPRGPTSMPQYRQPALTRARAHDARADALFTAGESAGSSSDKYVRTTVFLASVLFLVGISTHFPLRGVRYALIVLGAVVLIVSLAQLTQIPRPPR
jgi:hypothetical protein